MQSIHALLCRGSAHPAFAQMLFCFWIGVSLAGCQSEPGQLQTKEHGNVTDVAGNGPQSAILLCPVNSNNVVHIVDLGLRFVAWNKPVSREIQQEFLLENGFGEPIKIRKIGESCGCTSISLEKTDLDPGEQSVATIVFAIPFESGTQKEAIYLEILGKGEVLQTVTLAVSCQVCPRVETIPFDRRIVRTCSAAETNFGIPLLVVTRQLNNEIPLGLNVTCSSEFVTSIVSVGRESLVGAVREVFYDVNVTVNLTNLPQGDTFFDRLIISSGDDMLPVDLELARAYVFQPTPTKLFVRAENGVGVSRVTFRTEEEFNIVSVSTLNPSFVVAATKLADDADRGIAYELTFKNLPLNGVVEDEVLLRTDHQDHPPIRIPCYFFGVVTHQVAPVDAALEKR